MKNGAAMRASSGGRLLLFAALGALISLAGLGILIAQPSTAGSLATLDVVERSVEVRDAGADEFAPAVSGRSLSEGAEIRTNRDGLAAVSYEDGSLTRIGPASTYEITTLATHKDRREIVGRLDSGQTFHRVTKATGSGSRFEVQTSNAVAAVRGTEFAVQCVVSDTCEVAVTEGVVDVMTPDGRSVAVPAGRRVTVDGDGRIGALSLVSESDPWLELNADLDGQSAAVTSDPLPQENQAGSQGDSAQVALDDEPDDSDSDATGGPTSTTSSRSAGTTSTTAARSSVDFTPEPQPHPDRIDGSEETTTTSTTAADEEESTTTTRRPDPESTTTSTTRGSSTTSTTRRAGTTSTAPSGQPTSTTAAPTTTTQPPTTTAAPTTTTTAAPTTTTTAAPTTTTEADPQCDGVEESEHENENACPTTTTTRGQTTTTEPSCLDSPPPCRAPAAAGGGFSSLLRFFSFFGLLGGLALVRSGKESWTE